MVIKHYFVLYLFMQFCNGFLFSQGFEEQRKYILEDKISLTKLIDSSAQFEGLSFYNHSKYIYFDIYLDTPEFDLFNTKLSLRFRKRIFENGTITYGMQLKSEMDSVNSIRMEVEETELDFYKVNTNKGWVPLTEVIDVLFLQIEKNKINPNDDEIKTAISYIQSWIKFKAEGIIVPFQKIVHLKIKELGVEKIKSLAPMLYGCDVRLRNSVYINPKKTTNELSKILSNPIEFSSVPEFFRKNKDYIWALETSLDSAVFFPLFKTSLSKVNIIEFEVENKYSPPATGTMIMNLFEIGLKKQIRIENQIDSKYRQSIKKFKAN